MKALIRKLPVILYFTYLFNKLCFGFTLFFTILSAGFSENILSTFTIIFLTGGFGFTLVIYLLKDKNKLYFFLNRGVKIYHLFFAAYIIGVVFLTVLNLLIQPFL